MKRVSGLVAVTLAVAACVHVADDRARRDEQIGHAETDGFRVDVEDGLAAVHSLEPGAVVLWAGAPALTISLTSPSAIEWTVTLRNVLPDVEITATGLGGAAFVTTLQQPSPTEWRVTVFVEQAAILRVVPFDMNDLSPWRFAAFGDVQDAIEDVHEIYERMALDPTLRFAVISGDLTEQGSRAQLTRFMAELEALPIPCYATLGNHELGVRDDLFHDFFGRGNSRFSYRGVQLTLLDSASATLAPAVHDWLDAWLFEGLDRFHAVFLHIPPLDPIGTRNGGFASRAEAHALAYDLATADVDLVITGHLHSYYAYEMAGIPTYISGGGGAIPERFDGIGRHYLTIDVDPTTEQFEVGVVRVD